MKELESWEQAYSPYLKTNGTLNVQSSKVTQEIKQKYYADKTLNSTDGIISLLGEFKTTKEPTRFTCALHGEFTSMPQNVYKKNNGNGCHDCENISNAEKHQKWTDELVDLRLAAGPHTGALRRITSILTINDRLTFACNTCDLEFSAVANNVLGTLSTGCPYCAGRKLNTIYFYRLGTSSVYKVGLTSDHRGTERIRQVCSKHGVVPNILIMESKERSLEHIEQHVKTKYHKHLADIGGDGYTEMFDLTESQAASIVGEIKDYVSK